MASGPDLARALQTVVGRCLGVRPGEEVVVIGDPPSEALARALLDAARAARAEAVLVLMDERAQDGNEPPRAVAGALAAADVFIAPTTRSLSHTRARKAATERGARGATLPGATADMLARVMAVDFDALGARSRAVAEALDRAGEARITCPRGSDLRLDLRGRRGLPDDGRLTEARAFGNLPCGEGFVAPAGGEGRIVVATTPGAGVLDAPEPLVVAGGRLAGAEGPAGEALLATLRAYGELGPNLAELGVGTNDRATLTGSVLEDEKILGTIHVAFGASAGIGGTVSVPVHLDCVVLEPTLEVDGAPLLDRGRLVLDGA